MSARGKASALPVAPADLARVEAIVRGAGTSFYRGMRILAPARRQAMYAIYAFCRMVDDIADEEGPLAPRRAELAAWRARIAALCAGRLPEPQPGGDVGAVCRVLAAAIAAFALREADFIAVIDGMEMDAGDPIVAPDLATLDLYCDRVAAAVGRLSVRAFGDASAAADRVAFALGRALQLTNILRDVAEDAGRGRLYLPAEYIAEAGLAADPAIAADPRIDAVCRRVALLAEGYFAEAATAMATCDAAAMKPARMMAATYGALLAALRRRGFAPPGPRLSLPLWRKLVLALRFGLA
ncbi:MAG: presqualene diphosphate synthase HpnD [Rhodospirillales bacterium]|nr:presqualene diphosphate synthase HpnD [Rhodospirillales bacterium]